MLKRERGSTADDTDADGVHLCWFPGGKAATADAAMAAHLLGVLAWLRVSILEWIRQPPEVGVEVRRLYSWCHHGWGVVESVVGVTTS